MRFAGEANASLVIKEVSHGIEMPTTNCLFVTWGLDGGDGYLFYSFTISIYFHAPCMNVGMY